MRPRKYYMIRKDSLERLTDDLEQLINFFVIEFQRVVFVENIYVSATVCSRPKEDCLQTCANMYESASSPHSSLTGSSSGCLFGASA